MKHAGAQALDRLEPLLATLRDLPDLKERGRGSFYRKGRAFVHFHEDPVGLFADLRAADGIAFERVPVTTDAQRAALLGRVNARLLG